MSPKTRRVQGVSQRLAWWLLPLLLSFFWLSKLPVFFHRVTCPVQVQQEEAINMEFGRILLRGQELYPDIRLGGPYLHPSYPPLYPFLLSLSMRLLPGPWLPGRLPALLGYLACGILLAGWGWHRWGKAPSLTMVLLLWLLPTWQTWGSMARMDCLLWAVNFSAFLLLYRSTQGNRDSTGSLKPWLGAGLLNSLALLLKPTACTFTLAATGYAALGRKGKALTGFLAAALGPFLLTTFILQWKTGGLYLLQTVRWAATSFHGSLLWDNLRGPFLGEAGWLLGGLLAVFALGKVPSLLKWQVFFSALGLLALAREGAAENYYMGFTLFGVLALGEGFFAQGTGLVRRFPRTIPLYLVFVAAALFLKPSPAVPTALEVSEKLEAVRFFGVGEHLALDPDLPYMAGQRIWYQSSGLVPILREGLWDPEPLIKEIRGKKFVSVELYDIPRQYLIPAPVEEAIRQNYHVTLRKYGRVWLAPNG